MLFNVFNFDLSPELVFRDSSQCLLGVVSCRFGFRALGTRSRSRVSSFTSLLRNSLGDFLLNLFFLFLDYFSFSYMGVALSCGLIVCRNFSSVFDLWIAFFIRFLSFAALLISSSIWSSICSRDCSISCLFMALAFWFLLRCFLIIVVALASLAITFLLRSFTFLITNSRSSSSFLFAWTTWLFFTLFCTLLILASLLATCCISWDRCICFLMALAIAFLSIGFPSRIEFAVTSRTSLLNGLNCIHLLFFFLLAFFFFSITWYSSILLLFCYCLLTLTFSSFLTFAGLFTLYWLDSLIAFARLIRITAFLRVLLFILKIIRTFFWFTIAFCILRLSLIRNNNNNFFLFRLLVLLFFTLCVFTSFFALLLRCSSILSSFFSRAFTFLLMIAFWCQLSLHI